MFETIKNAWRIPDLRKKILFTTIMLITFRIGTFIPVPGLSAEALQQLVGSGNSFLGFIDIVTGGAFSQAAIFAMSISPYINASIIMQLLTVAIPRLEQISKEGEEGRKVIQQYVRYGAVLLGFLQAVGLYLTLQGAVKSPGVLSFITITLTFTAGTAFLMWLGEQITERGIGNGISLIIFTGIVSRIPFTITSLIKQMQAGQIGIFHIGGILLVVLGVVAAVVWVQEAERRIPVQYSKKVVGRKMYGGQSTHIPIKVNMASVIPIIFAVSILSFPPTIIQFFANPQPGTWLYRIVNMQSSPWYALIYALLVIFFTFFYTVIIFNPIELANNIKKNGGFIPGIRPGKPTADYISKVLNRVTWIGAAFLAFIAAFPIVLQKFTNLNVWFGSTSVLIVVGVAIETVRQVESQMLMRHYKGFLD